LLEERREGAAGDDDRVRVICLIGIRTLRRSSREKQEHSELQKERLSEKSVWVRW